VREPVQKSRRGRPFNSIDSWHGMNQRAREVTAFIVAPSLLPAIFLLLGGYPFALWSAIVTYGHALLLGVPIFLWLRGRRWATPSHVLIGAFLIGAIPAAILFAAMPRSGSFTADGIFLTESGRLTQAGVTELVATVLGLGILGALSGIVWLLIAGTNWRGAKKASSDAS
jgi:hypothetical protein